MKPIKLDSEFLVVQEEELPFSNNALLEILQEALSKTKSIRLRVKGFSMFPSIRDNDTVTVSPLNGCASYMGLPVAFINPHNGKLVIHRVIQQHQDRVVIKGDSILSIDGFILRKNILGVVTKLERNNRCVRFSIVCQRTLITFCNRTNIFAILFYIGMRLPRVIRQAIKQIFFA